MKIIMFIIYFRSFQRTFYVHNTLFGNFSLSDYYIVYIEDDNFFFDERNYDSRFWHTTKTYLIVSENQFKIQTTWPRIRRLWETFKVFKISLLYLDDLKVLRIFDDRFYKYQPARVLNYGIKNVKHYPLKVVVFPRVPSIFYTKGAWIGPDWETLQSFIKKMNFTLQTTLVSDQSGFGRFVEQIYKRLVHSVVL